MSDLIPVEALQETAAPFTDANFKLAVLSRLIERGTINFGHFDEFLQFIEGPNYDYENDGYAISTKAVSYLTRYPLSLQMLASVEELSFDGGLDIYPYIYPFWGGETEDFDIHSLRDIRLLPNLRNFGFSAMLTDTDLAPLAEVKELEQLELGLTGPWKNIQVLLSLPKLRYFQAFSSDVETQAAQSVIEELRERGVAIDIF